MKNRLLVAILVLIAPAFFYYLSLNKLVSLNQPSSFNQPQKKLLAKVASEQHFALAESICHEMAESAKARGTGIAKRTPEYLKEKMSEGKAIIATDDVDGSFVGFCYVETWQHGKFISIFFGWMMWQIRNLSGGF